MKRGYLLLLVALFSLKGFAQQYTGMSGLIHTPSADMDEVGDVRIGTHFLNRHFLPDVAFDYEGKYSSEDFYCSITPFSWVEIGYTFTLRKGNRGMWTQPGEEIGYNRKDQYFSLKLRPLKEKPGKWWPGIAIGTNDPKTNATKRDEEGNKVNQHFGNYYIAASKHLDVKHHIIGFHVAYREWIRTYNSKWDGLVGGVTYQPSFQQNLRLIAEYTGEDMNVGFDWKLWKHLLIQASLQDGRHFSGGICFCMNLL